MTENSKSNEDKKKEHGVKRFIAKRKMNSVYGKFATNPDVTPKIPYLKVGINRVAYIDTDSIHLVGTEIPKEIEHIIDDKELAIGV